MTSRFREPGAYVLLIAGVVALVVGLLGLYARERIFDPTTFADSAVATLDDEDVRTVTSDQITGDLISAEPNLVTATPLLQTAVATVITTGPFKDLLRKAAESANRAVFRGDDDALVTLANIGVLVSQAAAEYKPELAKQIPPGFDSTLVRIGKGKAATDAAQIAEKVSLLGLILPPLGLLLIAGSVFAGTDRRRGVVRAGAGVAVGCLVMLIAFVVTKDVIGSHVDGETDRAAFDSIWGTFLGDLFVWYLLLGGFSVILASAAASALQGRTLGKPIAELWGKVSTQPESTRGKVLWSLGVGAAGLVMILSPLSAVRIVVIIGGAYLLSLATSTLLGLVTEPVSKQQSKKERRRIYRVVLATVVVAAGAGALLIGFLAADGPAKIAPAIADTSACNGSEELCDRSIDKVSFAATHNSYAGANYPGYLFPEQDNTIPQQIDAGIRGLWIDTYYGIPGRRVYTDTSKLSPALISQIDNSLGPKFAAAGNRLRSQIARPPKGVKPEIYLCHGFCELGAVSARETFVDIAQFMADNPREVLIIDLEDYTTPADTQALIEQTGLSDYIYKGAQGPPWPTLQEMIDSGGRILLVSEHMTNGVPWYRPLNSTIQETPFDFKSAAAMTCKGGRGNRDTTLFLLNNWISTDPTPLVSNARKVNAYDFLYDRAQKCARQREVFPNVMNVDFYLQGNLFKVVDALNGVTGG